MASIEGAWTPERPAMTIQVGVTGHRALPDADEGALHEAAAGLFRAIGQEAARLHAADQASGSPLFQPTAPTLRCICGLAAGADTIVAEAAVQEGWTLVAALPFARAEFERDFSGGGLARFQALLARAGTVSELEEDRGRGGEPYAQIGRQIVEQSDVLLAVWDGLPPRGPGGTGDVVQQALDRAVPVGILPPSGAGPVVWRGAADIAAILQAALLPGADVNGFPQAYFQERVERGGWAAVAVRWFERIVLVGAALPASPWEPVATVGPLVAASEAHLLPAFTTADRLAGHYAARYRAAGLMRYGLVLPATLGSFIGFFGPRWAQPLGFLLQFASIVAVLVFSAHGGWARDQRRFIAYRALAEFLRNVRLLLPLGAVASMPGAAVHQQRGADWTSWYGRAVLRQTGLLPGRCGGEAAMEAARFVRASAMGEIAFLLGRAARYNAMSARLRRIGVALSLCGVGFILAHAGVVFAGVEGQSAQWFSELGLVVPAMAPVFLGLLGFGEYGRLSTRYTAVAAELQSQVATLDRVGVDRRSVLPIARRIAEVMLAEGADWQLLIQARTVSAY